MISTFSNLPKDLKAEVFSYLTLTEQALATRVNKNWQETMREPHSGKFLSYGRREGIKNLSLRLPRLDAVAMENPQFIDIRHGTGLFISKKQEGWEASLVDLHSKTTHIIPLSSEIEKTQQLRTAFLLSRSQFITLTRDGVIAVWKSTPKDSCLYSKQVSPPVDEIELIAADLIWIVKRNSLEAYDPHTNTLTTMPGNSLYRDEYPLAAAGKKLFSYHEHYDASEGGATFYSFIARDTNAEDLKVIWKDQRVATAVPIGHGIVAATDDLLITAVSFEEILPFLATYQISFVLRNINTGEYLGEFKESFNNLKNTLKNSFIGGFERLNCNKFSWLCGDFLVIWIGKELHFWHLPSRELSTTIDLKEICSPKELDDSHSVFCPIRRVEIRGKEIQLFLTNLGNTELRCVKYTLASGLDQEAVKKIKRLPERRIQKECLYHAVNRICQVWRYCRQKLKPS